jgi:YegS/Rv2252/BmrU family lipid kinase
LCNRLAGAGKAVDVVAVLEGLLRQTNIPNTVFIQDWPASFEGFTDIFLVGGDGTLNYFINHYPEIRLPLVIFKGGTGNDFHWLLYGETDTNTQLRKVLELPARPVDCGICNNRLFINGIGAGFEGAVAKALTARKKLPGKTSYLLTILQKIFSYRSSHFTIQSGDQHWSGKKLLVDISNGRRAGGGFHVAPVASADDGVLDLVIAEALSPWRRLIYLPVIEKGKHLGLSFITHQPVKAVTIESTQKIQFHLDGEYGEANALDIRIREAAFLFRY